jgi:hypothetical protein
MASGEGFWAFDLVVSLVVSNEEGWVCHPGLFYCLDLTPSDIIGHG